MRGQEMNAPTQGRFAPYMSDDTRFFWDGAAAGKLLIQRCTNCFEPRHPPGPACPRCHSLEWDATEVSGRGTVYSYAIHVYPPMPGFSDPPVVILVELEEGVRMVSNLVDSEVSQIEVGQPVQVVFVPQVEGWT